MEKVTRLLEKAAKLAAAVRTAAAAVVELVKLFH